MFERSAEIDDLAGRIFLAEHFCSREIQEAEPNDPVGEVRIWMELNDFDQAPIANSAGTKVVMRSTLLNVDQDLPVMYFAVDTPVEHWLDGDEPLQRALSALAQRDWLLVRSGTELLGVLTRHDLASPVVNAYLFARLLGLEHGLRRLYGSISHQPLTDEPGLPGELGDWSMSTLLNHVGLLVSLRVALGYKSRSSFERATGSLVALRNHLAHGRSILSISSRPVEAVERIKGLEMLMQRVRRLLDDREHIWDAFATTEILSMDDGSVIWAGKAAAALPLAVPVYVITAQNPHERVLTDIVNNKRHQLLHNYLKMRFPKAELIEVIGKSCSGPWAETGWAISGLSRLDALAIAYRFQQRAIFELTKDEVIVIGADAVIRITIPRLR
ncbi:DUF3293 domain-containing protein [Synechococcus lacustris C3-12m-Tous]|uniref:DUF3293 domain-containing protein n=1 Tax=Synechococcus lacustris TaxID=2116544 RepID=UPI0020CE74D3|nr:DUF3293 domain-containing protein [Synechococcus lacustris]MCP9925666.1 DUF3293 domain-containing protein [Synechococcus lacustris C3-12m-Tous]